MGYVYRIVNIENNKEYIGSTNNFDKRKKSHLYNLKRNKHHCRYLQYAFNKSGESNFQFEIIYEGDDYRNIEQTILDNNFGRLYNMSKQSSGGDLISYHPNRNEICEKIGKSVRERFKSPSERMKHSLPKEKNGNWKGGREFNTCDCGNTKKFKSAMCTKCRKRHGEHNAFFGHTHTDEAKKKISNSRKGILPSNSNKIMIDGVIFNSQAEASRSLNVSAGTITNRLNSNKFPNYIRL